MHKFNSLETELFYLIEKEFPIIVEHRPFLIVSERKYTVAGMYIIFDYVNMPKNLSPIVTASDSSLLVSDYDIILNGDNEQRLTVSFAIENGLIFYIELFNIGLHEWDGNLEKYRFVRSDEKPHL